MSLMVKLAPQNSWLCKYTLVFGGNKCWKVSESILAGPPPIWTMPKRGGVFFRGGFSKNKWKEKSDTETFGRRSRSFYSRYVWQVLFLLTFHNYYSEENFDSNDWLHGEQIGPSCVRDSGEGWCKEVVWRTSGTTSQEASQLFPVNGPLKACGFFSEKWQAWWFFAS